MHLGVRVVGSVTAYQIVVRQGVRVVGGVRVVSGVRVVGSVTAHQKVVRLGVRRFVYPNPFGNPAFRI